MFLVTLGTAQVPEAAAPYLQGYSRSVRGETIDYNSAEADVNRALLVRSLDSKRSIVWETQVIPAGMKDDAARFIWLFGIDASPETRSFDLFVDGQRLFRFSNPKSVEEKEWRVQGERNSALQFHTTYVDRHKDAFGYVEMTLPGSAVRPGKALRLEVRGESAGSRIWYMTFEGKVQPRVAIQPIPALLRDGSHAVRLGVVHLGEAAGAKVQLPGGGELEFELGLGWNEKMLRLPPVQAEREVAIEVEIAGRKIVKHFTQKPVRRWKVDLVQHSHTDIGYTRPQTEILPEHLRFIDYALDYCDATDHFPEEARFRWTCEASWPVREYLRTRPREQVERLRRRVKEGRIEVTGMMFNMSEIPSESLYVAYLQPIRLFQEQGLAVTTAMQNDVNGAAWCLPDHLSGTGIKYLTMGQHGHRALIPFEMPTAFWWEAPSGKRLLAFRAEHYNTGNFWGIHTGNMQTFERGVSAYLDALGKKGYGRDRISIQYSGYMTDNSPPALIGPKMIKTWNEKYSWPKLRSSVARDFLAYAEEEHEKDLPVIRAAWPDWWTDGFGTAARETAAARRTQSQLVATEGLFAMARLFGSKLPRDYHRRVEAIHDALLFYEEHTFGADVSVTDPFGESSMVQWAEKAAYVWEAVKQARLLQEVGMGLLRSHLPGSDVPSLVVVNTLNFERSGLCEVYVDHEILPPGRKFRIVGHDGKEARAQRTHGRSDGSYWSFWVPNIPPLGYRVFRIEVAGEIASAKKPTERLRNTLENEFYKIVLDPSNGTVTSLIDKELARDLVDHDAKWGFGQFIHEKLGNRRQLERFRLEKFSRHPLDVTHVGPGAGGLLWQSLVATGRSKTCAGDDGVRYEIRLFHGTKRIEFHYRIKKLQITDPEGIYVAFPFDLPGAEISYEAQGGIAIPGKTLLPGTASDWQTVQSFARARSKKAQILLMSPEIPLFQFGGINLGRFRPVAKVEHPHMYSWVLNNYWVTNFQASQQGELRWSYVLTSTKDCSDAFATRTGWSAQIPLLSRVLPARKDSKKEKSLSRSALRADSSGVLLVGMQPVDSGVLLHLRECAGEGGSCEISGHLFESDVLGRKGNSVASPLRFAPKEVKFVRVNGR